MKKLVLGSLLIIGILLLVPSISATQNIMVKSSMKEQLLQQPERKGFHPFLFILLLVIGKIMSDYNAEVKEEYDVNISFWLGVISFILGILGGKSLENLFRIA